MADAPQAATGGQRSKRNVQAGRRLTGERAAQPKRSVEALATAEPERTSYPQGLDKLPSQNLYLIC